MQKIHQKRFAGFNASHSTSGWRVDEWLCVELLPRCFTWPWPGRRRNFGVKLEVNPVVYPPSGFIQTSPVSGDAYFRDLGGGFLTNPSETYAEVKLEIFYPIFFGWKWQIFENHHLVKHRVRKFGFVCSYPQRNARFVYFTSLCQQKTCGFGVCGCFLSSYETCRNCW